MDYEIKSNSDGTVTVKGLTKDFLQKSIDHRLYLLDYRKTYSSRKRAKVQFMRKKLESQGVDLKKLEQDAVRSLK